ncbi:MAG TPA: roadblock/LC7 domain-containing protein [Thermoplasmata archaeon]
MNVSEQDLKRILRDFNARYHALFSAVVSRSGVPIAWELPPDVNVENVAMLSATILGASEVIYSGMKATRPLRVLVESETSTLIAAGIGERSLLVAMVSGKADGVIAGLEAATNSIRNVLRGQG